MNLQISMSTRSYRELALKIFVNDTTMACCSDLKWWSSMLASKLNFGKVKLIVIFMCLFTMFLPLKYVTSIYCK